MAGARIRTGHLLSFLFTFLQHGAEAALQQRQVLLLYYAEGLNMREIGEKLGVDKSTVSRNIKRGERRLRRCLRSGAESLFHAEKRETKTEK